MYSIAIIVPFFGKWPIWKNLFLDSCQSNSDIDFFIFTDCEMPITRGHNIHYEFISFKDYCQLVSDKLNILFDPPTAYKLCDLKPFYGYIHAGILQNYDFWGFCDVDLVFGNIRNFYTEEILKKYDVLSTHFDRLSGHFALFRNNDYYRTSCFKIKQWDRKLQNKNNCILDESDYSYVLYPEIKIPRLLYAKIWKLFGWDFAHKLHYAFVSKLHKIVKLEKRRIRYIEMNIHPIWTGSDEWRYYIGDDVHKCRLMDFGKKEECMYCHFLPLKKNQLWQLEKSFKLDGKYKEVIINRAGIVAYDS